MKNYIKYVCALLIALVIISCEETPVVYSSVDFVQLGDVSAAVTEDSGPIVTSVLVGAASNPNGVTVDFTVTSDDSSRFSVTPASGTIEIPAGEFSADITITPIDNFAVDGDVEVTLALAESSDLAVGLGGEGVNFAQKDITIIDNDCPIDIDAFVGTYSVAEVFTGGTNEGLALAAAFGESYQIEISLLPGDTSGTKVVINSPAGFDPYVPNGTVMSFNTCPGTVTFDAGFPVVGNGFRAFVYDMSSYSEAAPQTIKCEGPLSTFGPYEFVFTKM